MSKAKLNRLFALVLAFVMTMSIAIPAFADTITIKPSDNTDTSVAERFEAYQIFSGKLSDDYNGTENTTKDSNGYYDPNVNQLADVKWGSGINHDKIAELLAVLVVSDFAVTAPTGDDATYNYNGATTLGAAIEAALKEVFGVDEISEITEEDNLAATASVIAHVIADMNGFTEGTANNNSALAREFASIVSDYLSGEKKTSTKDGDNWTIETDGPGYYLITDTQGSGKNTPGDKNDSKSDWMLGVFGTQTITIKSDSPTVKKTINGATNPGKGDDFEIGESITFTLTGTLPENFAEYVKYYYAFHDTMDEGLSYHENSVVVTIGGTTIPAKVGEHTNYTVTYNVANNTLDIVFTDLKNLKTDEDTAVTVTKNSEIVVTYTAELNEKATVSSLDGNKNKVKVTYTNDPTWDGDGDSTTTTNETPEDTVYVYDFGIDLNKFDAKTKEALAGAGFAVSKGGQYAVFAKTGEKYTVAGWISANDAKTLAGTDWAKGAAGITGDKIDEQLGNDGSVGKEKQYTATATYYLVLMTPETTGKLDIEGLDSDSTYTLEEVITPDGYDTIGEITVKFAAEYYDDSEVTTIEAQITDIEDEIATLKEQIAAKEAEEEDATELKATLATNEASLATQQEALAAAKAKVGKLKSLTATITGIGKTAITQEIVKDGAFVTGTPAFTELMAQLNVPNTPAGYLPGTGGMGTYLFYIGGGLLLACAVLFLVLSNRKKKQQ